MKPTDKQWTDGYFSGYESGKRDAKREVQLSLFQFIKEIQPYKNGLGEHLPWETEEEEEYET